MSLGRRVNSEEGEYIVAHLNDHIVVMLAPTIVLIAGWLVFALGYYFSAVLSDRLPIIADIIVFVVFAVLILMHHWYFVMLIDWALSNWTVTNKRIFDFESIPFVKSDTIIINIDEIHEIEKIKRGFWPIVFNYGDIIINLAASPAPITLKYVPNPSQVVNLVEDIRAGKDVKGDLVDAAN